MDERRYFFFPFFSFPFFFSSLSLLFLSFPLLSLFLSFQTPIALDRKSSIARFASP